MDKPIRDQFEKILNEWDVCFKHVLEVGATQADTLLTLPALRLAETRVGFNADVGEVGDGEGFTIYRENSHCLPVPLGFYDIVLSSDTLEHDEMFWLSTFEMHRVLKPGGLMVIAVPGFAPLETDGNEDTITYKHHPAPGDYYRFSPEAVRDIFFEGFTDVDVTTHLVNGVPRIVAHGVKA